MSFNHRFLATTTDGAPIDLTVSSHCTEPTYTGVEVLVFDPQLRARGWEPEVFERPRLPTPRLKAHWVTALLAPATARERVRLQRGFESVFTERVERAFFRKVFALAEKGVEGDN